MNMFDIASSERDALDYTKEPLPASPTAPLEWAKEQEETGQLARRLKLRKSGKSVSFVDDVKLFDGLSERTEVLDALVKRYFVQQQEVSELDVLVIANQELDKMAGLREDLSDVLTRLSLAMEEGTSSVPVLPRGGGTCTKLCPNHAPYVRILDRVVEAASNRLRKILLSQQQLSQQQVQEPSPKAEVQVEYDDDSEIGQHIE